jgi:cobalt transporter subunit CbtB
MRSLPEVSHAASDTRQDHGRAAAIVFVALLGLVLVYGAGAAPIEALHNAAHDARHAAGLPCH